ncbi:MAG: hypothetical protein ACFFCD_02490 [Promethearchaeota archaeon]
MMTFIRGMPDLKVAVIIPAYNEEGKIGKVYAKKVKNDSTS